MAQAQETVLDRIKYLAKASRALTRVEDREAHALSEIGKQTCREAARELIQRADHGTCMQFASADGTPIQVSDNVTQSLGPGRVIRRFGKSSYEFLCAAHFTRWRKAEGGYEDALTVRDPMPLTNGKKASQITAATRSQWQTLRQAGHLGGAVQGYVYDRCCLSAISDQVLQWHELMWPSFGTPNISAARLWLLELVIVLACAMHDAQSSFRWSLPVEFEDADLLRDVYVGIQSCRNSFNIIIMYLAHWIALSITFVEAMGEEEKENWRTLWRALGMPDDVLHQLVDVFELRCIAGRLLVVARAEFHVDLVGALHALILAIWRFQKFTESRWLTVGSSARSMVAAQLTGLTAMLTWTKHNFQVQAWYLNGFWRIGQKEWLMLVQCALVATVPDVALLMLIEDARVALHAPAIRAAMVAKMTWLVHLPSFVWLTLGVVAGIEGPALRRRVIRGAHRSLAFFTFRVLDKAEELPFRLCRGDIAANLDKLKGEAKPRECNSGKLWELLHKGYPVALLVRLVLSIADVPWSTLIVEQMHASAAVLARFHPEYGLMMLMSRAMILIMNKLLPGPSALEAKVKKMAAALRRLDLRCPEKAGGRHEYFRDLAHLARKDTRTMQPKARRQVLRTITKTHGKLYKKKPEKSRQRYKIRAKVRAAEKRHLLQLRRAEMSDKLLAAREKVKQEQLADAPLSVAGAKWTQRELDKCQSLKDSGDYGGVQVQRLKKNAAEAPERMSPTLLMALAEQEIPAKPEDERPDWIGRVCSKRELFTDTAFIVDRDGHREVGCPQIMFKDFYFKIINNKKTKIN